MKVDGLKVTISRALIVAIARPDVAIYDVDATNAKFDIAGPCTVVWATSFPERLEASWLALRVIWTGLLDGSKG